MTNDTVKTASNSTKKVPGKPFVKGDPRINRKGRPTKDQIGERKLWQDVFAEYLTTTDDNGNVVIVMDEITGKPLTRLKARIRVATGSRNAHEFGLALERAYGKVSQPLDIGGEGGLTIKIIKASNDTGTDSD
jgi:hypothetical protein